MPGSVLPPAKIEWSEFGCAGVKCEKVFRLGYRRGCCWCLASLAVFVLFAVVDVGDDDDWNEKNNYTLPLQSAPANQLTIAAFYLDNTEE